MQSYSIRDGSFLFNITVEMYQLFQFKNTNYVMYGNEMIFKLYSCRLYCRGCLLYQPTNKISLLEHLSSLPFFLFLSLSLFFLLSFFAWPLYCLFFDLILHAFTPYVSRYRYSSNLVHTTRFWNNLHRSEYKDCKLK